MKYILKTDISGIQKFIFDIPSKNAAKQLKARSFYVYSLTHIVLEMLREKVGQTNVNVIYNGGGNLFAFVETEQEILKEFRQELENQAFQGVLFPFVSFVEVADNEDFKTSMQKLSKEVLKTKLQRKFSLAPFDQTKPIDWAKITENLVKSKGFVVKKGLPNREQISLADFVIAFEGQNFDGNVLNKLPKNRDGSVTDFVKISENVSEGADEKIAALKIDVDNLGLLFRNREEAEYRTLSSAMEKFFSKDLYQKVLKQSIDYQEVYPVFAGGDDLFFIGSWDKLIGIAQEIHREFKEFQKTLNLEKPLTLSAGIVLGQPKFPLIRLAEEAEIALEIAKNYRETKNSICLFGQPMGWEEFLGCESIKTDLYDLIMKGESKALLQRIKSPDLGFQSMKDKILKTNRIELPKVYRLKYYLRNAKNAQNRFVLEQIFKNYADELLDDFLGRKRSNPAKYVVAARWTELLTRKI